MTKIDRETPAKPLGRIIIDFAIQSTLQELDHNAPAPTERELAERIAQRARNISRQFSIPLKPRS